MTTVTRKESRPHTVRLRVSQQELDWLRDLSEREERTIANILRQALRKYVETNK